MRASISALTGSRSIPIDATLPIIRPVGATLVETMATLVAGSRPPRFARVADDSGSNASSTSTRPGVTSPIDSVDTTGPAFWLSPVWSTELDGLPTSFAAVASTWLDGHHPGAADARHPDRRRRRQPRRVRQRCRIEGSVRGTGRSAGDAVGGHRHEGGAVTLEAAGVDVAAGLVDDRLAAELGVDRMEREAVRLDAAVAAALAHALVDHDPEAGLLHPTALALAALLGRALLIVDEHGDSVDRAQLLLGLDDAVAVHHVDTAGTLTPRYLPGSSVVMTTRLTPSASSIAATSGTGRTPAASWPPVIATAAL